MEQLETEQLPSGTGRRFWPRTARGLSNARGGPAYEWLCRAAALASLAMSPASWSLACGMYRHACGRYLPHVDDASDWLSKDLNDCADWTFVEAGRELHQSIPLPPESRRRWIHFFPRVPQHSRDSLIQLPQLSDDQVFNNVLPRRGGLLTCHVRPLLLIFLSTTVAWQGRA